MSEKYLNMNTEELFQKYPINKIVNIQKEIQYEIDKKHQELRTMVGERYRDVIEASDTIKLMQESATNVVAGIQKIVDLCENINAIKDELNRDDCVGTFALEQEKEQKVFEKSISMQIKILIYIPEQIWTAIDENSFLKATQLYLLAQHIYTGLKLDTTNNVLQNYPIIKTQWMKIEHFHKRIHTNLHAHLQNSTLSADVASNYLTAYALLENISVSNLLHRFIEFRKIVLQNELQNENLLNHHHHHHHHHQSITVKALTCSTLKLIINTIQLIYLCFIDGGGTTTNDSTSDLGDGLVYVKLKNIVGKDAQPTINIVDLVLTDDTLIKYLPTIVTEYKPIVNTQSIDLITAQDASDCIQTWLDWVKQSIHTNLTERLNMVTTIKGLDSIREEALKIKLVDNWEQLCIKLLLSRNFNVWFLIYQPMITQRVQQLIVIKWNHIVEQTERDVLESLINVSSGKTAKPEIDLRWFTWKEEKTDVPLKLNVDGENKFIAKGLLMKSKGYSPNVLKLCEDFDNRLAMLLNDLDVYLFGKDVGRTERAIVRVDNFLNRISTGGKMVNDKFSDKHEIQDHLQQISRQQMERLITNIILQSRNTQQHLTHNEQMSYNLMIARFLLAIQQLSPNLLRCFKCCRTSGPWTDFCMYLLEQRLYTWSTWLDVMDARLLRIITDGLMPCIQSSDVCTLLEFYPQWSIMEVEEKNEDNVIHTSEIRIPSQVNFYLQNLLFKLCSKLNSIIPHTLPRSIHVELIDRIMLHILNIYQQIINNNNKSIQSQQSQALQLLFDIKYMNVMFISRDHIQLQMYVQEMCEYIRTCCIDPFDYDVFYPYLQQSVLVAAQKTQCILGILIYKPESLAASIVLNNNNTKTTTTTVQHQQQKTMSSTSSHLMSRTPEKDAMILPISNCTNVWFPLLPVTAPLVSRSIKNTLQNTIQTTTTSGTISTTTTTTSGGGGGNIRIDKKKIIKSSPKHSKLTDNTSSSSASSSSATGNLVRSGAASFLSDWFG